MIIIQLSIGLLLGGSIGALLGYFGKCTTGACPLTANPVRGMLVGALIGAMFSFSLPQTGPIDPPVSENSTLIHIETAQDFDNLVLQSKQPVLVDFYSNACPPCRRLSPVIAQLADQFSGRAVVAKVNVDRLSELASRYRVSSIPAVLFYEDGKETKRIIGYNNSSVYVHQLETMTNADSDSMS